MQQQIKFLAEVLEEIDRNPEASVRYFNCRLDDSATSVKDIRYVLIKDSLHKMEHHFRQDPNCAIVDPHVDTILKELDRHYHNHQHLCWRSHEHHFHTSFDSYVNCPITCLCEISEFLNKLIKEIYHQ